MTNVININSSKDSYRYLTKKEFLRKMEELYDNELVNENLMIVDITTYSNIRKHIFISDTYRIDSDELTQEEKIKEYDNIRIIPITSLANLIFKKEDVELLTKLPEV